jgi:two-component system CheB/CheR fusion protein
MGSGKSQGPAARRKKPARAKRATPRAGTATAPPASPPAEAEFPVAAIGASAGGLEAVSELLRAVPPAPGLALVLVQHLDPDHASVLAEILGRTTTLPVQTVEDGAPIRPDAVFVIPPNHGLELADGHFRLTPRDVAAGRPMPVDQFFHSLADTYRTRAIGVVLSGTNSDGALGLQAIKAEGGIAIAQTPDSARFPEMPRAALSEGPVDFVLAPGEIGRELAAVAVRMRTPLARDTPQALQSGKDAEQLSRIFSLLRSETRVDFSLYRETTIRRRITRRLILNQVASLEDYVGLLRRNRKELRALYDDLLITVTAFFRDPETYQILSAKVFPQILKHKNPETPIRIWVPGCATGEEVYSLAISLFEALQGSAAPPPVQIFGTDISELAVEKARAGLYLENSLVNVSPERMRAFFRKSDGGYQISKRLRDVCVFARQNVASDPPFSNIDLLSCRNLLIYLEPALQRRVMPLFHYALQPTGFLVLGPAESVGLLTDLFQPIDQGHRIFAKKAGAVNYFQYRGPRAAAAGSQAQPQVAPSISMRTPGDVAREADRIVLGRYAPPGVVVDENLQIVQFRGRTTPYLEPAPGAASLQLDRMARNGLGIELRRMIEKARRTGERVRRTSVPLGREAGEIAEVHVEVVPMGGDDGPAYFLVLFEEPPRKEKPRRSRPEPRRAAAGDQRLKRLESELAVTKEYLQSIIEEQEVSNEELKSANEEILSSNEELQSTNEELETAKEELQSTNEELRTVNDELQNRNVELTDVSNDLVNLFHSINVAIVMVGARGEVRRFTAMAEKLLNLRPTDVGRPLSELRPNLKGPDLAPLVSEVIETMNVRERELQDS